jgi:restriction system protein
MSRRRNSKSNDIVQELGETLVRVLVGIATLFIIYVVVLYKTNPAKYWYYFSIVAAVLVTILIVVFVLFLRKKKRWAELLKRIETSELEKEILSFIHSFGNEKTKDCWKYRSYIFDRDDMRDFAQILNEKGLSMREEKLCDVLEHYIDREKYRNISESIPKTPQSIGSLDGTDFELLLQRLYLAKGFQVQRIGGVGDQGGDLIANKAGDRLLIQAKRYTGSVPNAAVQQAFTAKTHHNCTSAAVVTTGEFTREAREVAKTTGVRLIGSKELKRDLMEYLKENWS